MNPMYPRPANTLRLVLLLAALGACSDSPTESTPETPPATGPELSTASPLVPGTTATLSGKRLSELASLSLDGKSVSFEKLSDTEVRFTVPELRACETDGRAVALVANDDRKKPLAGTISLPEGSTTLLEVGESRILSAADLGCLQLSKEDATYVLSVASLRESPLALDTVFLLRSWGAQMPGSASRSALSAATVPAPPLAPREAAAHGFAAARAVRSAVLAAADERQDPADPTRRPAEPFDPRYATAQVGDTLTFVDWRAALPVLHDPALTRETIPTHRAVVLAVSGKHVIVVDLGLENLAEWTSTSARAIVAEAAARVERYAMPALHATIAPGFPGLPGAGGRSFTVIRNLPPGLGGTVLGEDIRPQDRDVYGRFSSEMMSVLVSGAHPMSADALSSTIIHELAHSLAILGQFWSRAPHWPNSPGWYGEALAVNVEETAARLSQATERGAQSGRGSVAARLEHWPAGTAATHSPFGELGMESTTSSVGSYDVGARMLLFARERLGLAGFHPAPGTTLHERLVQKALPRGWEEQAQAFSPSSLAEELGLTLAEFIDQYTLAELTTGLVHPVAVERYGLPQIVSWENRQELRSAADILERLNGAEQHLIRRDRDFGVRVTVPTGSHHHWYLAPEPGKGLSLEATQVQLQPHHKVRLTRLR